jgi:hypothetical protein
VQQVYPDVRYLDASDSGMTLDDLDLTHYLVHVRLRRCNVSTLSDVTLPNLRVLDLSHNLLQQLGLGVFASLGNLRGKGQNPVYHLIITLIVVVSREQHPCHVSFLFMVHWTSNKKFKFKFKPVS